MYVCAGLRRRRRGEEEKEEAEFGPSFQCSFIFHALSLDARFRPQQQQLQQQHTRQRGLHLPSPIVLAAHGRVPHYFPPPFMPLPAPSENPFAGARGFGPSGPSPAGDDGDVFVLFLLSFFFSFPFLFYSYFLLSKHQSFPSICLENLVFRFCHLTTCRPR